MTSPQAVATELPCNLCGSRDYQVVLPELEGVDQDLSERYRSSSDDICREQIVRCSQCDLVYINPRAPVEMIHQGYAEAVDDVYVSQAEGRLHCFRRIAGQVSRLKEPGEGRLLDVGAAGGFFLVAAREAGWNVEGIQLSTWRHAWNNLGIELDVRRRPRLAARRRPTRHAQLRHPRRRCPPPAPAPPRQERRLGRTRASGRGSTRSAAALR